MTAPDLHLDTAAMALDALPPAERDAFVQHLAQCETCPQELAEFRETLARLAVLTAAEPPAALRGQVLAAVAVTTQLPPLTRGGEGVGPGRHRGAGDAPDRAQVIPAQVIPLRPWYRRTATLIAAAVVAMGLLVGSAVLINRPDSLADCVAAAPDATVSQPVVGDTGDVTFAPSCSAATVDLSGMAAPPAGRQYQMWVIAGDTVTSAGLLPADASSPTMTLPVTDPTVKLGISVEPTGGSPQPTSDPIWVAAVT